MSLTFTSANWDSPQTVVLTAAEDDDVTIGSAIFTLRVVDSATGQQWFAFVRAEEVDDDFHLLVTTPDPPGQLGKPYDPLQVTTPGTASFYVALSDDPAEDVTVTVRRLSFPQNGRLRIVGETTEGTLDLHYTSADAQPVLLEIADPEFRDGCQGFEVAAPGRAPVEVIARQVQ